ncbi:hypothetical protein M9H77_18136 [Catharanthus roseus]|uniref:Uncharacterized protein n=1 Tax=Catharanthus roseus TaxID=4058 RepID=A0ACC0B6L0_CATRO|nr:hypothetical protein M9H77_18136 [Catharanthus roseus]
MRVPPARVAQGGLAGIDYVMPEFVPIIPFKDPDFVLWVSQQRLCVLICSEFPTTPKPFREFITCIQAIFMKLIFFWHVKPFYKKHFTRMGNSRRTHVNVNLLGVHRSCFPNVSPLFQMT